MLKIHLFFLLPVVWLIACSQTEEPTDKEVTAKTNPPVSAEITEYNSGNDRTINNDSVSWNALPENWEMITNKNEKFVRYRSCEAGNPSIAIDKEKMEMNVFYGQEGIRFKIISWKYEEKEYKDELEYYYTFKVMDYNKTEKTLVLNYDKGEGVSSWSGVFDADGPVLFIPERLYNQYPEVKQPCRECFPEEDCEGME